MMQQVTLLIFQKTAEVVHKYDYFTNLKSIMDLFMQMIIYITGRIVFLFISIFTEIVTADCYSEGRLMMEESLGSFQL